MCCSVLQYVASSCSELQCVTVCCCVLPSRVKACLSSREKQRSTDLALRMLQCVAASGHVCCSVLQCIAACCSVLPPRGKARLSSLEYIKRTVYEKICIPAARKLICPCLFKCAMFLYCCTSSAPTLVSLPCTTWSTQKMCYSMCVCVCI